MTKLRNKIGAPGFIAMSCTMVFLVLFLFTSPVLSLAGDVNISEYLSSSKVKSGFFFISPVLAGFLRMLNPVSYTHLRAHETSVESRVASWAG